MTDTTDLAIEYFQRRRRVLEDEILRRQMALQEVEAFLDAAQDGRSSLSRERKARAAKAVAGGAATDGTGVPLLTLPDAHMTGGAHQEQGK